MQKFLEWNRPYRVSRGGSITNCFISVLINADMHSEMIKE